MSAQSCNDEFYADGVSGDSVMKFLNAGFAPVKYIFEVENRPFLRKDFANKDKEFEALCKHLYPSADDYLDNEDLSNHVITVEIIPDGDIQMADSENFGHFVRYSTMENRDLWLALASDAGVEITML